MLYFHIHAAGLRFQRTGRVFLLHCYKDGLKELVDLKSIHLNCWSNIRKYENNTRIPIIIIIKKFTTSIIYEININRDKVRKTDKLGN